MQLNYFYELLVSNRNECLTWFYESFFAIPDLTKSKWNVNIMEGSNNISNYIKQERFNKITDNRLKYMAFEDILDHIELIPSISLQKNDESRRVIRNLHYMDILHHTKIKNTAKSHISFWQTLTDLFNKNILADRFFATSSI